MDKAVKTRILMENFNKYLNEASVITNPKVHTFDSYEDDGYDDLDSYTEYVYDETQTDENIHDGDILYLPQQKIVAFMYKAWPVAVVYNKNAFGRFHIVKDINNEKLKNYKKSIDMCLSLAKEKIRKNKPQQYQQHNYNKQTLMRELIELQKDLNADKSVTNKYIEQYPEFLNDIINFVKKLPSNEPKKWNRYLIKLVDTDLYEKFINNMKVLDSLFIKKVDVDTEDGIKVGYTGTSRIINNKTYNKSHMHINILTQNVRDLARSKGLAGKYGLNKFTDFLPD